MSTAITGFGLSLLLFAAGSAQAGCVATADANVATKVLNASVPADAQLLVSMALLPKFSHLDYAAASKRPACDLGRIAVSDATYELWGDDTSYHRRVALPDAKGAPISILMSVSDIRAIIAASGTGKSAPIAGYLLATVGKSDFTGWRFYTGIPDADTLKHDMAEVLGGVPSPIFRNEANGKTIVFLPKG